MKTKQLKSGNWHTQVVLGYDKNGKRIVQSITASTEWEVIKIAEEVKHKRGIGVNVKSLTVGECLDYYIESRNNVLSPTAIRSYKIIRNTRLQTIMNIKADKLKISDLQFAVNADSLRLSHKSIKDALSVVKSALAFYDININIKKVTLPKKIKKKNDLPSVELVLDVVSKTEYELPCLLAMWLSLRIGEVRGLQFRDISSDGQYIMIQRQLNYIDGEDVLQDCTKTTESTRKNRLPPYLLEKINCIPHESDTDFIVQLGYNKLYKGIKRKMAKHGFSGMTFHKLRHLFATTANDIGVSEKYIQKLGGWSSDHIMKTVYTHTTNSKEEVYQQMIDSFFENAIDNCRKNHTEITQM